MPTVSFLMSNYKTPPAFLRRALDSMLAQTFADFEIVAINDGVRDASYEMLLEYAAREPKIVLIENEQNLGLPASLNRGIERCRGKYIARMDTDDICYPDRLERQVAYMDAHPEVMFAGAWADVFAEDENEIVRSWRPVMCSQEEFRIRLLFANDPLLIHPTVIFRADFLKNNKLRYSEDPLHRYSEDYEMWTRCADMGRAGILEHVVLKYRDLQTESRITVRNLGEMGQCKTNVQRALLGRLEITLPEAFCNVHSRLLSGRKPYDLRYKLWMDRILSQNRKKRIYDQATMKRLFHERWFNIVYYGIAYEKNWLEKTKYCFTMYPDGYVRLAKTLVDRSVGKKK